MTLDLISNPGSVGVARDAARRYFADHGTSMTIDIELVVSELVTNAIRHSDGGIALHLTIAGGTVLIAVHDASRQLPVMRHPDRSTPGGRGLHIIDEVAEEWGAFPTQQGKAVWCLVAAPLQNPKAVDMMQHSEGRAR